MNLLNLIGIQDAVAQNVPSATPPAATAPAEHAAQGTGAGFMSMIWMVALFIFVFYFILIRPQSKRAKEQRKLIDSLNKGDEVVTTSGMVGKIVKITDDFVVLNVAENVDITLQKGAIISALPKGTLKSL
jgi:preprotein translocase subunit YajC